MSTATSSLRYVLARAAIRSDALMHVVSQRDTGLLNPICAAHPIRSAKIDTWTAAPADLSALCADCAECATSIPGISSIEIGLAVWLGGTADGASVSLLTEVPLHAILSKATARTADDGLVEAVRENGVVTPLLARRTPAGLELIDGERRLDAARAAGLTTVPVAVRDIDDEHALVQQLLANLHRRDLDPIGQALAFQHALDTLGCTKTALADHLGLSRPVVPNTLRLLRLPEHLRAHVADGTITAEQGRRLTDLFGTEQDEAAAALLERRQTGAAAPRAKTDPALAGVAAALTGLLEAKVRITRSGDTARVTLDVADADLPRVLELLGRVAPVAVAA